jgi:DNA repair exonuclease SbcCD ATPase subunit
MSASPSPALKTAVQNHFHFGGQTCPYCGQPIPEDKLEEISGRIEARARERLAGETERLREQYNREREQAEAKARAELDQLKKDSTAREARIRDEASKTAVEAAREQIAQAQKALTEAEQAGGGAFESAR